LIEAEVEGVWRPVLKLLACRPKDLSEYPPELVAKLPVYDEGTQDAECTKCGCGVTLGPRQALAYDMAPDDYMLCCMVCATMIAILYGDNSNDIDIEHLGGE
jgi:hypothetical protein